MSARAAVFCPVDFSDASRGALRYAAVIAAQTSARLAVLTVNDPLLVEAAEMSGGAGILTADARRELERFFHDTFRDRTAPVAPEFIVAAGRPDREILRLARDAGAAAIVMSSRGATGVRKLFFGSTTERVLRETTIPILVTPAGDAGPGRFDDIKSAVRRILLPVDLSDALDDQVRTACTVAEALAAALLLVHVVEPVRAVVPGHEYAANVDNERRDRAERRLQALVQSLPTAVRLEPLVMFGEPAEEIAKIALDRGAGLIVMGLHASALLGPRMGSVTYRVLSLARMPVLALPPAAAPATA
jgi:nucleotide-binding universal stress UspA family protein